MSAFASSEPSALEHAPVKFVTFRESYCSPTATILMEAGYDPQVSELGAIVKELGELDVASGAKHTIKDDVVTYEVTLKRNTVEDQTALVNRLRPRYRRAFVVVAEVVRENRHHVATVVAINVHDGDELTQDEYDQADFAGMPNIDRVEYKDGGIKLTMLHPVRTDDEGEVGYIADEIIHQLDGFRPAGKVTVVDADLTAHLIRRYDYAGD